MKMRRWLFGVVLCFLTGPALAQDQDQPGTFDYYVLAISWSPNWCERTGNARNSPQCANDRDLGWSLHGSPVLTYDGVRQAVICGQAITKDVPDRSYEPSMDLSRQ